MSAKRLQAAKRKLDEQSKKISLDDLYARIKGGEVKGLKIILKADVQGSLEAIKESLQRLSTDEVTLSAIHHKSILSILLSVKLRDT